jgi:hypothetical protein
MERRRAKRVTVNLKAERISCTKNCSVFIENLSETGISMITSPTNNKVYVPGSGINLKLKLSTGDIIKLNCNVKWYYDSSSDDMTNSVGLEIIDPPDDYMEFLKTLN